jgi:hypothetical protein
MIELTLEKECVCILVSIVTRCLCSLCRRSNELQTKIQTISNNDYAHTKVEVDRFREELGQPALPSLQAVIEEKSQQCVATPYLAFQ